MTEHVLQLEQIAWFRNELERKGLGVIIPVPNEATYKDKTFTICKGASDIIVVLKKAVLFIENKTTKGFQKPDQITFQNKIESLGYEYHICRSLDHFKMLIEGYL